MREKKNKPIFINKKSTYIDKCVKFGKNVTIYENVRIEGETFIDDNTVICSNTCIFNSKIGKNSKITYSYIENSIVGDEVTIGPFAHLRPNSVIKSKAKIGNFVEIKNAEIGEYTKVSHLSYVGDASLGKDCNIGCGAIFVNYNGKTKNKTIVGDNSFIGSNCNVIAPVNIESNTYIVAGTTVTSDVKEDDFVIGRVRQENKPNKAHVYLKNYVKK